MPSLRHALKLARYALPPPASLLALARCLHLKTRHSPPTRAAIMLGLAIAGALGLDRNAKSAELGDACVVLAQVVNHDAA